MTRARLCAGLLGLAMFLAATPATAQISRTEVIDRGRAFVFHPWRATSANATASCAPDYHSQFPPGDYLGVAYNWGGFDSLFQFDQKIADGEGAGNPPYSTVYSCTAGVDCSGFVSQAWHTSGKYGTWGLEDISTAIDVGARLPGDVFNQAGYHVALYVDTLANGSPRLYEAAAATTDVNATGGWSYLDGYTPRRYDQITGTTVADPPGTLHNPIEVSLPYGGSGTTANAPSDLLDGCAADPGKNESGREVIYQVTVTQPGQLTATVFEDVDVDVDVHLYQSQNTNDCVARDDKTITHPADCGTYYVVVDTFRSASTGEHPGAYDLSITLAPSGGVCGDGPPQYDFAGQIGDPCHYPGDPDLPYCNRTLGADVCIYTSGSDSYSFCSIACTGDPDCAPLGADACCDDFDEGERYCVVADLCPTVEPGADGGVGPGQPDAGVGPGRPDGGTAPDQPDAAGSAGDRDSGIDPGADDPASGGCRTAPGGGDPLILILLLAALAWRPRRRTGER